MLSAEHSLDGENMLVALQPLRALTQTQAAICGEIWDSEGFGLDDIDFLSML